MAELWPNRSDMRLVAAYIVAATACHSTEASDSVDLGPRPNASVAAAKPGDPINPRLLRRFRPLRHSPAPGTEAETAAVTLGHQLFFDQRLSAGGTTSCHSCHQVESTGADSRPRSVGADGRRSARNAPTVFNAAGHVAQFWDGREPDLERQAGSPILGRDEMAMHDPAHVTAVLRSIPGYAPEFTAAFGANSVDFEHATRALGAYERTLRTPSRWDAYLEGDRAALTSAEIEGLKVFSDAGCIQCHTGEMVGGSMFQKVGIEKPWPNQTDQGRFAVTHVDTDRMVFKVPSLRNVTLTAPYFHDGSVESLPEAVQMMARHQLGTELTPQETASIIAWLGALTGKPPALSTPVLPESGPATAGLVNAR